jgi:DNA-directed RNA polymerase sigma subunit (sigma70/sigma32)
MRKKTTSTVTESSAQALLRRGGARRLDATEEKVMRMRLGAALPRSGELEWVGTEDEELEIEIRALEIETWMKMRAHQAASRAARPAATAAPRAAARAPATAAARTKEKIVRALRRKGPTR